MTRITQGIGPKYLSIYIYIYIIFPILYLYLLKYFGPKPGVMSQPRRTFDDFCLLTIFYFVAFTILFLNGLNINLLILLLTFCVLLKNIRNNNIIKELIKIKVKEIGKK